VARVSTEVATERKDLWLKDVAAVGGWKDVTTLVACYSACGRGDDAAGDLASKAGEPSNGRCAGETGSTNGNGGWKKKKAPHHKAT
jgi:hypothetical protein